MRSLPSPLFFALFLLFASTLSVEALGAEAHERSHGLSAFGDLKYPADFSHFDYANPKAPKGGRLSLIGTAGLPTFNSLNFYILKGDAAQGLPYIFDSLMVRAWDEPDALYGLVAHSVELSSDKKTATFYLREGAKFADGTALTADDVIFSFNLIKSHGHPFYAQPLRDVAKAEVLTPLSVRYSFTGELIRDLPLYIATLPIFSKAYYQAHAFDKTSLKAPLGSGPYKVGPLIQGRFITYKRRPDYWAKDLPVNVGRFNFDELRYDYFRDRTAEFEALKAGQFDLREEFTSKVWATQYDIPAVREGRLIRATLPDNRPSGAQGFFINLRRAKFKDPRTREALALAFDFQWTNRNQFYDLYQRTESFFENSEMKAEGPPSPREIELLQAVSDHLDDLLLGEAVLPPVTDGSGQDRKLLRRASKLLRDAGWQIKNKHRVNKKGERFRVEFLIFSATFERIITPFIKNLKILGIEATIRRVDPAQYQERLKSFDFDITTQRYVMPATPGAQLRTYWGSAFADVKGSFNLSGIKDPRIDRLIEKVIAATTRKELNYAARALDRVLRAGHYWIPHWYKASHNVAYWDKFGAPRVKPRFHRGIIETWWFDKDKARKALGK